MGILESVLVILLIVVLVLVVGFIVNLFKIERGAINNNKISFRESMDLMDLPIVTFTNNGNKFNFLLDTGATHSALNLNSVSNVKGTKVDDKQSFCMGIEGGQIETQFALIPMTYKDEEYVEEFQIMDLTVPFTVLKDSHGVNLHGILGNSFFQKYKYIINFDELIAYSVK